MRSKKCVELCVVCPNDCGARNEFVKSDVCRVVSTCGELCAEVCRPEVFLFVPRVVHLDVTNLFSFSCVTFRIRCVSHRDFCSSSLRYPKNSLAERVLSFSSVTPSRPRNSFSSNH